MDTFSRCVFMKVCKDKKASTILAHFREAFAFYYKTNPHKKYAYLTCDQGSEFKGTLKE